MLYDIDFTDAYNNNAYNLSDAYNKDVIIKDVINKTRFFYVLYSDQSERAKGPIYLTINNKAFEFKVTFTLWLSLEDMQVNWIKMLVCMRELKLINELHD